MNKNEESFEISICTTISDDDVGKEFEKLNLKKKKCLTDSLNTLLIIHEIVIIMLHPL